MMECNIDIDGKPFSFHIEGDFFWGNDEVLFRNNDNVISRSSWKADGYNIFKLLSPDEHAALLSSVEQIILRLFDEYGVNYDATEFKLENYHHYANSDIHQKIIQKTRFLTYKDLNLDVDLAAKRMSGFMDCHIGLTNPLLDTEIVILRISRPESLDINPPHRDGYLDVWRNTLNLWVPLAGCNENTSLPLIPGSHYWNEKDIYRTNTKGASINGLPYHVPGIAKTNNGLKMIRPNPQSGEVLVFTPFLIHGCAVNLTQDTTRFSLELRLFNQI